MVSKLPVRQESNEAAVKRKLQVSKLPVRQESGVLQC